MKNNLLWLWIVLGIVVLITIIVMCLPKSKRRFLSYLLRQAPSLIARYFV